MKTILFSDPHLGLRRTANTTPASRARLQDEGFKAVEAIYAKYGDDVNYVCLGDWFDTYSNPESVVQRAAPLISQCAYSMAGNHDLVNDADRSGSLQLLRNLVPDVKKSVGYLPFGQVNMTQGLLLPGTDQAFHSIPHVVDQALFDQGLAQAYTEAQNNPKGSPRPYLLLHCNYDNTFAGDTDLNITRDQVKELLEVYDTIFLGHEHNPRTDFEGRLRIIGNTLPTGFGDISNKYVTIIDEQGKITQELIWERGVRYRFHDWAQWLPDLPDQGRLDKLQFVQLDGKAALGDARNLAITVKSIWNGCPNLLALKTNVEIEGVTAAIGDARGTLDRLPEIITRELEGSGMFDTWKEILKQIESE